MTLTIGRQIGAGFALVLLLFSVVAGVAILQMNAMQRETSRIEGATLIPLREIPSNLALFEEAGDAVVLCHHGIRSLDAAAWLRSQG